MDAKLPDASPCDYFLWGYIKHRLNEKKPRTILGLKNAIKEALKNDPQENINRALEAWPKRCRKIYYRNGGFIENSM